MIIALLTVLGVTVIELFRNRPSPIMNIATTLFGVFYVSFFFGTLVGLRELFNPFDVPVPRYFPGEASLADPSVAAALDRWGGLTIVSLFASIWLCDSAAYAIGIPFGKHKLFPRVSPKKSWEGAIAGLLAGVAGMLAARTWFLPFLTITDAIVLGFIVGGLGQIGDLVESLLKRDASVKDSSNLIPGHGGVLDRFDSLLFVSPLVYLYIDFVVFS
jgi:phosphatidate cytidylyltransferase